MKEVLQGDLYTQGNKKTEGEREETYQPEVKTRIDFRIRTEWTRVEGGRPGSTELEVHTIRVPYLIGVCSHWKLGVSHRVTGRKASPVKRNRPGSDYGRRRRVQSVRVDSDSLRTEGSRNHHL